MVWIYTWLRAHLGHLSFLFCLYLLSAVFFDWREMVDVGVEVERGTGEQYKRFPRGVFLIILGVFFWA